LESLYISSLREFLSSINGSIVTEHSYTIPLQRVHDRAIMDVVLASNLFTPSECKTINYCRMFLRVHSIADLTLAGGNHIDFSFLTLFHLKQGPPPSRSSRRHVRGTLWRGSGASPPKSNKESNNDEPVSGRQC
jgi:hypothetical protein